MATIRPVTVVIRATFIPPATMVGEMSPSFSMLSNACTIPTTVPKNPNEGATAIQKASQDMLVSSRAVCTPP